MRASLAVHWATKDGNATTEYEDAWAVEPDAKADEVFDARGWRCAVADGASESLLAGGWATELTREFSAAAGATRSATAFAEVAARAARRWPNVVNQYVAWRASQGRPLAWYENLGLDKGAFATLLAIEVARRAPQKRQPARGRTGESNGALSWRGAALGDTCVFQVRRDRLHEAFPVSQSRAFGTSPLLVGTKDPDTRLLRRRVAHVRGELAAGDDLYLCTDALAAWFLAEHENGRRPWRELEDLDPAVDLRDWLRHERASSRLRNDDVTLVHLSVCGEHG